VQRQIDPARPISKHAFGQAEMFFNESEAKAAMNWLRTMGATDVYCWPADQPQPNLEEGEHWFTEYVSGLGTVIAVAVTQHAEGLP